MSAAIVDSAATNDRIATSDERMRADIQTLRGLAVMLVVLQHFDILFVVSGYLITGLIQRDIQAGKFSK